MSVSDNFLIGMATDPGRDPGKQVNEDAASHEVTPLGVLAIVCDGMGGHAGGREAAELALRTIATAVRHAPKGAAAGEALRAAIAQANDQVFHMQAHERGARPGSTVVCALFHERGVELAHVGDSRAYLIQSGAIAQVTRDHSMVEEMVARGLLRPEDAAGHPEANKITRALGMAKTVDVEVRSEPLPYLAGSTLVLCSDGVSDLVSAADLHGVVAARTPAEAASELVAMANARGGHDNITAVVVRAREGSLGASEAAPTLMKTLVDVPTADGATTARPPAVAQAPAFVPAAARIAPPPTSRGPRFGAALIVALAIGALAVVVLGTVIVSEIRGGSADDEAVAPPAPVMPTGPGATVAPTPLEPDEPQPSPEAAVEAPSVPPLAPPQPSSSSVVPPLDAPLAPLRR